MWTRALSFGVYILPFHSGIFHLHINNSLLIYRLIFYTLIIQCTAKKSTTNLIEYYNTSTLFSTQIKIYYLERFDPHCVVLRLPYSLLNLLSLSLSLQKSRYVSTSFLKVALKALWDKKGLFEPFGTFCKRITTFLWLQLGHISIFFFQLCWSFLFQCIQVFAAFLLYDNLILKGNIV